MSKRQGEPASNRCSVSSDALAPSPDEADADSDALEAAESDYNTHQHFQKSKLVNLHSSDMEWQRLVCSRAL